MIKQTTAQIFKSDLRAISKSDVFLNLATFNFGTYQDESRNSFGTLKVLNEGILAPSQKTNTVIETATEIILLPLFGGISYKDNSGNSDFIRIEQIKHISAEKGMSFELSNPYELENVSYLEIWFTAKTDDFKTNTNLSDFDFSERNKMNFLFEFSNTNGFIGIYDGRKEGFYTLKNNLNGVFVFVINGAFEVENRLLQEKDGLSLKKVDTIEWEALSQNAILLLFEVPI
ncbi:pirin [Flavobacterium sp. ZT3R18]|uniref:pirin family protein n=1 Tax=Flavobacterium sp. ZT3R18 TaxID=2594429 RepID=UPI00117A1BDA|nr:pirin [Flavobacterium sp. ZT3R18]TRX32039.1 pirin [Flavobacterium sp. ZT3R18]